MPATATKTGVKMKTLKMLIDGQWVASSRGTTRPVLNPATEEVIAEAYDASPLEVGQAVAAAKKAFDSGIWSGKSPAERAGVCFSDDWATDEQGSCCLRCFWVSVGRADCARGHQFRCSHFADGDVPGRHGADVEARQLQGARERRCRPGQALRRVLAGALFGQADQAG